MEEPVHAQLLDTLVEKVIPGKEKRYTLIWDMLDVFLRHD
jgi:hypothetical protein